MLFYDEFSGLIYQGKIVRIQANKAVIETPKKTFKVSISNVKLLHKEQSLIKSEFFSRDESDQPFKVPRAGLPSQMNLFNNAPSTRNVGEKGFGIPKANDLQNLSSFLKTNQQGTSQKDQNDFSIPLFPQNSSGLNDSLQFISQSNRNISKKDFSMLQSFQSKNQTSSKFQSILSNSAVKDLPQLKVSPSHDASIKSISKPLSQVQNISLTQSQQVNPLNNSLFAPNLKAKSEANNLQSNQSPVNANQGDLQAKPSVIDHDLVNFAILFKLLQKKKKLAEKHDQLVKNRSESNLDTNNEDLKWVKQSVTQIDKTLKNVWLSLKLRDTTITSKALSSFSRTETGKDSNCQKRRFRRITRKLL